MPVDNLVSNWAYMVMASLAWTLIKGVVRFVVAWTGPMETDASRREGDGVADGVQTFRECNNPRAVSGSAKRAAHRLSFSVVEPMAACVLARRGCLEYDVNMAASIAVLNATIW